MPNTMSLELQEGAGEMEEIEFPIDDIRQCFDAVNLIADAFNDTNFWLPDAYNDNAHETVCENIERKPCPAPPIGHTITTLVGGPTSRNEAQTALLPGTNNSFLCGGVSPTLPSVGTKQEVTNTRASMTQSHQSVNSKGKLKCNRKKVDAKCNTKITTRPIVKALTPYNFFFRFERSRLLKCIDEIKDPAVIAHLRDDALINYLHEHSLPSDYNDHYHWTVENSAKEQREILEEQWGRDASVKRVHCKSHGRFTFSTLTKHIAARWRALPIPAKTVFRAISGQDYQRYNSEKH